MDDLRHRENMKLDVIDVLPMMKCVMNWAFRDYFAAKRAMWLESQRTGKRERETLSYKEVRNFLLHDPLAALSWPMNMKQTLESIDNLVYQGVRVLGFHVTKK